MILKQSAGIILFDLSREDHYVLCLRAYKNWDFPKGGLDDGETHLQAALRELEEETGYTENDISLIESLLEYPEKITYGSGKNKKEATYYYAVLKNIEKRPYLPINPTLGKPEHEEWRWVPIKKLYNLLPDRLKPIASFIEEMY